MKKKILVVHNNLTGDLNGAKGVAKALARKYDAEVEVSESRPRNKPAYWIARSLLRRGYERVLANKFIAKLFFANVVFDEDSRYIAIVSSLGKTEVLAVFLANYLSTKLIHIGTPKKFYKDKFDYLIAHPGNAAKDGEIFLPTPPTQVFPNKEKQKKGYCSLLLGGDFAENQYSEQCWEAIIDVAMKFAESKDLQLYISTSQRTSRYAIDLLKKADNEKIEIEFYDASKPSQLSAFLNKSDYVFVMAESISMMGDALAMNIPVYAISSKNVKYDKRIGRFLQQQEKLGHIAILDCGDAESDISKEYKFNLNRKHFSEYLLDAVELEEDVSNI